MQKETLNKKIIKATKWSTITEFISRLIMPVTNMILARILAPDVFGIIATITMIVSFADMFTDSGFQKYLIQHEFKENEIKENYISVAFWTNLFISIFLWLVIILFSSEIAIVVGNPGLGNAISVACIQLPLTSFSSIQMSVYRRKFDFKTLFYVRIVAICIPFFVTIPLALMGYGYWSLIIGTVSGSLFNAVLLTIKSEWKPKWFYDRKILKEMMSFSIWSLIEAISIWLTVWADTFVIGSILTSYHLGIYKNSLNMVNAIFMIITASIKPILFSALSRLQNDDKRFNLMFLNIQKMIAYLVIPMSVGLYVYSDLAVGILFGEKWKEASLVVGIWGISSGVVVVLSHCSSEVYRAKGKPKLSFWVQVLHLIVLIPACAIAAKEGFEIFVKVRGGIRLHMIFMHMIVMKLVLKIPIGRIFKNITIPILGSIFMGTLGFVLKDFSNNFMWQITSIVICTIFYFMLLMSFKNSRNDMIGIALKIKSKRSTGVKREMDLGKG